MRKLGVVVLTLSLGSGVTMAGVRPVRYGRCCVVLAEQPPLPACIQIPRRGRLAPRLLCRLIGGTPRGRGDCSLALCAAPGS